MKKARGVHQPNDKGYKVILSHKETFVELLRSFVNEAWVHEIDKDDLTLVNKSFILKDYQEKEADIVYKLKIKGKEVYVYILLELQSVVDFTMPFRLLLYMTEIWRQIFSTTNEKERERKNYRLPAIVPMILYNGANGWTAKTSFKEMQEGYELFHNHVLDFNYVLFNVNGYSEEELFKIGNMIASVFLLDQKIEMEEFILRFKKMVHILRRLSPEQLARFKQWLKYIIVPKLSGAQYDKAGKIIAEVDDTEVEKMIMNFEIAFDEAMQKAEKKGIEKGMEKGVEKGENKKAVEVARNLLLLGVEIEKVVKATGLTEEEVRELQH